MVHRTECRDAVCGKIEILRKDYQGVSRALDRLQNLYHDQALGIFALSSQLKLLLQQQKIQPPKEIDELERKILAAAKHLGNFYGEDRNQKEA